LPSYFWDDANPPHERRNSYVDWRDRHIELPPVVE
jgi:hypothetical protein